MAEIDAEIAEAKTKIAEAEAKVNRLEEENPSGEAAQERWKMHASVGPLNSAICRWLQVVRRHKRVLPLTSAVVYSARKKGRTSRSGKTHASREMVAVSLGVVTAFK
jgi:hypothetical protein